MFNPIFRRGSPANTLGFFTAALLISAASVHPQTPTPSDPASGGAMQSGQSQSGAMQQGSQSDTQSGKQSSGTSGTSSGTSGTGTGTSSGTAADTGKATGAAGGSNTGTTASTASGKALSAADRNMMRDLAYANLSEVAMAKLAQEKTSNDEVRNYAQRMIDDHSKAMDQLQQLAQAKGVQLPTAPDATHQAMEKKLRAMSGQEFDRQYMQQAGMQDHRKVHSLVARVSTRAQDPELKTLAGNLLPNIDQHLQMAQKMRSSKGAQTSSGQ